MAKSAGRKSTITPEIVDRVVEELGKCVGNLTQAIENIPQLNYGTFTNRMVEDEKLRERIDNAIAEAKTKSERKLKMRRAQILEMESDKALEMNMDTSVKMKVVKALQDEELIKNKTQISVETNTEAPVEIRIVNKDVAPFL